MFFSMALIPPAAVSFFFNDKEIETFLLPALLLMGTGFFLWFPQRKKSATLRTHDGFLIVTLFWVVLGLAAALPFWVANTLDVDLADSVFEAVSGLTTTGSTVFSGLDYFAPSILFYRQELHFLGGMGVILLAVAILPMLGVGGMQLFRAEATGPVKDTKLTPRIAETAKALWLIYLSLNLSCFLSFWIAGMPSFDALLFAMGTVATGGLAPHDKSLGFYDSPIIHLVTMVFMFLGAVNFSLHYSVMKHKKLTLFWRDPEFKAFCWIVGLSSLFVFAMIFNRYPMHLEGQATALLDSAFQVISFISTTGYSTADYLHWPSVVPIFLLLIAILGGCAGSTSGGIKTVRFILLCKQGIRELRRLVHPAGHFLIKLGEHRLPERVIESVWGFLPMFLMVYLVSLIALMVCGVSFVTAFSAAAACISNSGPALGDAARNFQPLPDAAKWILSLLMIVGRLEIFTILVLLSGFFWRK